MKIARTVFKSQNGHKCDRQTDTQMPRGKTICLPTLKWGREGVMVGEGGGVWKRQKEHLKCIDYINKTYRLSPDRMLA